MNAIIFATAALLVTSSLHLIAGPLAEARVTRVVNEVKVASGHGAPRRVVERETIQGDGSLRVGPRSRAEMIFADQTLTRLGSGTDLGWRRSTRELTLGRGTLLLEVPGFRGGARVRLGSLTAVCGAATVLIEHLPARSLKIVVLQGDLRVSAAGPLGDSLVILPGKMLITTPDASFIADPVDVDLRTLVSTSTLIDGARFFPEAAPLASLSRIAKEVTRQAGAFERKRLIPTNLAIVGSGTNLLIPGQVIARSTTETAPIEGSAAESGRDGTEIPKNGKIAVQRQSEGEAGAGNSF